MVTKKAQIHMDDEVLKDGELIEALVPLLDRVEQNREAAGEFGKAVRKIKKMMPDDGKPHRFRIGEHVVVMTPIEGGREVDYTTQDGVGVKINPKDKASKNESINVKVGE